MDFGSEVTKENERFGGAGVFEDHSTAGRRFDGEEFVLRQFVEAQQLGAVEGQVVGLALSLPRSQNKRPGRRWSLY